MCSLVFYLSLLSVTKASKDLNAEWVFNPRNLFNASSMIPRSFPHLFVNLTKEKSSKKEKLYMMIMVIYNLSSFYKPKGKSV